ncbi:MAG TPA: ElyC/SanA/YdcF family protein [Leptolinea sp.]
MVEFIFIVKKTLIRKILLYGIILLLVIVLLPAVIAYISSAGKRFPLGIAPQGKTAIVFGAGLYRDGSPSAVLRDRVQTAVELYKAGKVEKLLMSGDNSTLSYNEPGAMKKYAMQLGVPENAIVQDFAGRRTYDTCFRAKAIFGITEAILVTQDYHLPRAMYICKILGLNTIGVSADRRNYRLGTYIYWRLREIPATFTAFIDLFIRKPQPILGNPEPIYPPDGDNMEQEFEEQSS